MAKGPSPMTIKARNPGKKYDKTILECSTPGCHNEFLISTTRPTGLAYRKCAPCVFNPPQVGRKTELKTLNDLLVSLNLI